MMAKKKETCVSKEIRECMHKGGKPQKQCVAIAHRMCGVARPKGGDKKSK